MSETSTSSAETLMTVRIIELPVDLHVRASEHMEALNREFAIIRRGDVEHDSVPARLHALTEELEGRFTAFTAQPFGRLSDAIDAGEPRVDLEFVVPASAADAATRLGALLDEADSYCRAGRHLLTLTAPAEVIAYRQWFLEEFARQGAGHAPVPWSTWLEERAEGVAVVTSDDEQQAGRTLPAGWSVDEDGTSVTVRVAGDLDLQAAPALRELLTKLGADVTSVTLDLGAVTFLDSVGISVLIAAYQRLTGGGASFSVIAAPRVLRTLTIAGVAELLDARPAEPVE